MRIFVFIILPFVFEGSALVGFPGYRRADPAFGNNLPPISVPRVSATRILVFFITVLLLDGTANQLISFFNRQSILLDFSINIEKFCV